MWFINRRKSKIDKELEKMVSRYKAAEEFAKIGDYVEYLGVKMLVVGHHDYNIYTYATPSIKVEWMDTTNRLQQNSIRDWEFPLCKVLNK